MILQDSVTEESSRRIQERQESERVVGESFAIASSSTSALVQANVGFTREQTLFPIDLMRQHLESDGDELPQRAEQTCRIVR